MPEPGPRRIEGWSAFFGWFFVGALAAFAFAAALSIGGLALPFVLILGGMMIWARPPARSLLGVLAGAGALVLALGLLHLGDTPCDRVGVEIDGVIVYDYGFEGSETSCSDFNATPWLAVGGITLATGTGLFVVAERGAENEPEPTAS